MSVFGCKKVDRELVKDKMEQKSDVLRYERVDIEVEKNGMSKIECKV